ncbi:MAG TPA: alginate export family protein [Geobacteraceae bacterium]
MCQLFLVICCFALLASPLTCHAEVPPATPSLQTPADISFCREIAALAQKYGADRKLPDSVVNDGKPCPRGEAASCLLSVIIKVQEKCAKEGWAAVPQEDMDRIAALHEAMKNELAQFEGYATLRETIEKMLAKSEEPAFEYKVGVNGFLRGEGAGNFRLSDFSYNPGHSEGRFLYRVKPYAYWHPADWLDIHAEGQGFGYAGGGRDFSRYSLYQGFVETRCPTFDWISLKAGRQEFVYGSAFILGADAFMDGQTFDALRLRLKPMENLTVDLLGGWYATPFSGGVSGDLEGGYVTWTFSEGNTAEGYAFRDTGSQDHHAGEYRNSWGMRGTAKIGPVSLEVEPVYQAGRQFNFNSNENQGIDAYGGHADLSVDSTLAGYHNHLFASYAIGSGDSEAPMGISSRKEFSTPSNDSSLFGDMKVIGGFGFDVGDHHASGMQIYTLGWGLDITKELNFSATGRYFHARYTEPDFSRNLGLETDFTLTYTMSDNLSLIAGYDRFFTGGFFRDATGSSSDIHYGYAMLQFDLAHQKPKVVAKR